MKKKFSTELSFRECGKEDNNKWKVQFLYFFNISASTDKAGQPVYLLKGTNHLQQNDKLFKLKLLPMYILSSTEST